MATTTEIIRPGSETRAATQHHCWLCYKPGAPDATQKLRALSYYIAPKEVGYAHASCIRKRERKLRSAGFPKQRREDIT